MHICTKANGTKMMYIVLSFVNSVYYKYSSERSGPVLHKEQTNDIYHVCDKEVITNNSV